MFTWDGVGLGEDDTLWGGEALFGQQGAWRRVASLRPFCLPGGDRVGREPWRSAAALHWACDRPWQECPDTEGLLHRAWQKKLNCPETSAAGRLFDAAAALITGMTHTSFEAEGPMLLEALCREAGRPVDLPLQKDPEGVWRTDWEPLLNVIGDASRDRADRAEIFHSTMAQAILQQARQARAEHDFSQVGLCGGVFQNRVLAEQAVELLQSHGFRVCLPRLLPCNDAALSYGQAAEFAASQADR